MKPLRDRGGKGKEKGGRARE